jgi:hypothetical protein
MVNVIVAREKINCEHLLGKFVDESHYDLLINEDTDCYMNSEFDPIHKMDQKEDNTKDENKIAFKFRKNFFTKEQQEQAYLGLREAATPSQNRGLAAGPKGDTCGGRDWVTESQIRIINFFKKEQENTAIKVNVKEEIQKIKDQYNSVDSSRGLVWLGAKVKEDNFNFESWLKKAIKMDVAERKEEAHVIEENYISDTTYANAVNSGIAGWFDRYPRIPYGRATSYTQNHFDKFKMSFPFLQTLNNGFKELVPWRWSNQRAAADKIDSRYLVPETVFTTITVNKTFRTACHRDAGDFTEGLSNLLVLSNDGNYTGGYLVFPEYRVAVNVRPGDLLLVNNHEIIHGNTPIVCQEGSERISLVCYLREGMLNLGSKEYEDHRFNFVESRRKNKEHPLHKKLWNGVSEGMWNSNEWYNYLKANGGDEMVRKYHPEAFETVATLDDIWS